MSLSTAAILMTQLIAPPEIPPKTLHAAQEQGVRILASAHIRLIWTLHAHFQVNIVGEELQGASVDAMGLALMIPGLPHAAVSWQAVSRAAKQMEIDPATLLGAVLAHEIGHLLFGPGHTRSGIMSPRLGPREMRLAARGALLFDNK